MRYFKKAFIAWVLFLGLFVDLVQAASPVVISTPVTSVDEDSLYSYTLGASDGDNDPLTWSVTNGTSLPSWLTLNGMSSWLQVGSAGFSIGKADSTFITFDNNNIPYVAYEDIENSYKVSVMKFNGSAWVQVGIKGFNAGQVYFTHITFDNNNIPYVVCESSVLKQGGGYDFVASVMKFNGSAWVQVGIKEFSIISSLSITFDNNNTPYVVYAEDKQNGVDSVMKFNGSAWVQVGTTEFSISNSDPSIAFDNNNTPYVVYTDYYGLKEKVCVRRFDGSAWVQVGTAGFSAGAAYHTSIAIDNNNTPYVAYLDDANGHKVSVMKFNGSAWVQVGIAGFSEKLALFATISIAIDNNNAPYVFYTNGISLADLSKASVMKFNGSSWIQVESARFNIADDPYIAFDNNNTPYVVYKDGGNGDKASVMKFDNTILSGTPTHADIGDHNINLTVSDGTNRVDHSFTITVNNLNDAPTDITLSNNSVSENSASDAIIGTLSATDEDEGDTHTFSFCGGSDDNNFTIDGATLKANGVFNYEVKSSYSVCVRATDEANATFEKNITIAITDVNDAPIVTSTPVTSVDIDNLYSYALAASDEDGDPLTWSVTNGTSLPGWLTLNSTASWEQVGSIGFSAGGVDFTSIAFDNNNNPYVVYTDIANGFKASVMKFNGSAWVQVGIAGFSADWAYYISIAFDNNNTPYVVYQDASNDFKASVMKFNGSAWVQVGTGGFSTGEADYTSIAIDSNDILYVAYQDIAKSGKASVMKFDGSSAWGVQVGTTGFSADIAAFTSMAFDSNDILYVAYQDIAKSGKASVMKFDGSSWVQVGYAGFSAGWVYSTSIAIDSNNTPYVVYSETAKSGKASVMKFDGSSWVQVGIEGFSADVASFTSIAIDSNNTPYVVYSDYGNSDKASVMKFDGSSWVQVGSVGFSAGKASYTSMAFARNNTPYVVYKDAGNSDKASVMKFALNTILSGTPSNADVGDYTISLTLSDSTTTVDHNFTIRVNNINDIPTTNKLTYESGWSLKALPRRDTVNATDFSNIVSLWKYSNGKWTAYAPNSADMQAITDSGIDTLSSVTATEGFWINAIDSGSVGVNGSQYDITVAKDLSTFTSGWYLLGNGTTMAVATIAEKNPNINIIWTYSNNRWYAYSPDSTIEKVIKDSNIETFENIKASEGFWIKIGSSN